METRKVTNQLLQMVEDGILDPQMVLQACLVYMSEADVAAMAHCNELLWFLAEEDEEDE